MKTKLAVLIMTAFLASGYAEESRQTVKGEAGNMPFCEKHRAEFMTRRQKRDSRNKKFMNSIKDMEPAQRQEAMLKHAKAGYEEDVTEIKNHYQEKTAQLKEHIAANPNLDQKQKEERSAALEKRHQKALAAAEERYDARVTAINASPEERKALRAKAQEKRKERTAKMEGRKEGHDDKGCVMCAKEKREVERPQKQKGK